MGVVVLFCASVTEESNQSDELPYLSDDSNQSLYYNHLEQAGEASALVPQLALACRSTAVL